MPSPKEDPEKPIRHLRIKVLTESCPEEIDSTLFDFLEEACIDSTNYINHSFQDNGHRCSFTLIYGDPAPEDDVGDESYDLEEIPNSSDYELLDEDENPL